MALPYSVTEEQRVSVRRGKFTPLISCYQAADRLAGPRTQGHQVDDHATQRGGLV